MKHKHIKYFLKIVCTLASMVVQLLNSNFFD